MEDALRQYDARWRDLELLRPKLEGVLADILTPQGVSFQTITTRVKKRRDVERKFMRADYQGKPIDILTDFLGARIVVYFSAAVDQVAEIVERELQIDPVNSVDKRKQLNPNEFGYMSLHYVATLKDDRTRLAEYASFDGVWFELQIRTVLQHAWAEIEHDLGYKPDNAIPPRFRRRFSRLAGMLEMADDEFVALRGDLLDYGDEVQEKVESAPESLAVDQVSLMTFVRSNDLARRLDNEISEACGAELGEEEKFVGRRAVDLDRLGYKNLQEVAVGLEEHAVNIPLFATSWLGKSSHARLFAGISLFYLALLTACSTDSPMQSVTDFFIANGHSQIDAETLAETVLSLVRELED